VWLLNVTAERLLAGQAAGPSIPRDGALLGALFESLVASNLRVYAQSTEAEVRHLRTHRGDHEVDFIVTGADGLQTSRRHRSGHRGTSRALSTVPEIVVKDW
jgi:predicted AAA+ superfamily ATPase